MASANRPVLNVSEWSELRLPQQLDRQPIKARLLRAARSAAGDALQIRRGRIFASGLVGLVATRDLCVQILPKVFGESDPSRGLSLLQGMLRLEPYVSGEFSPAQVSSVRDDLLEFMVFQFANRLRRQLDHGIPRRYFERSDWLETIRGRVELRELSRVAPGGRLRVPVTHSPLQRDNNLSRMIRALVSTLSLQTRAWVNRQLLAACDFVLSDISACPLTRELVASAEPNAFEEDWRWAYDFALLLAEGNRANPLRAGPSDQFSILFSLHGLFERSVRRAFSGPLPGGLYLRGGRAIGHLLSGVPNGSGLLNLQPDLVFGKGKEIRFVGDAKWREVDRVGVVRGDAYQLASYVWHSNAKAGVLFYPSEKPLTCGAKTEIYRFSRAGLPLYVVKIDVEKLCGRNKEDRNTSITALHDCVSAMNASFSI